MWTIPLTATLFINLALSLPSGVTEIITGSKTYTSAQWQPAVGSKFQITLSRGSGGNFFQRSLNTGSADILDLDLFDTSKTTIQQLHAQNKRVICYFSAGSSESWRQDYSQLQPKDKGDPLRDWPREQWLDIRSDDIFKLMQTRIKLAADKGCDGIDPDNVDAFGDESRRGGGFAAPLKAQDTIAYVTKLANEAHQYGLAMGLKNAETLLPQLGNIVEFAVNEQCATYAGCRAYQAFLNAGKPVFHIEYAKHTIASGNSVDIRAESGSPQLSTLSTEQLKDVYCFQSTANNRNTYASVPKETGKKFSTVIKNMDLSPWVMYCDGSWESGDSKGTKGNFSTAAAPAGVAAKNPAKNPAPPALPKAGDASIQPKGTPSPKASGITEWLAKAAAQAKSQSSPATQQIQPPVPQGSAKGAKQAKSPQSAVPDWRATGASQAKSSTSSPRPELPDGVAKGIQPAKSSTGSPPAIPEWLAKAWQAQAKGNLPPVKAPAISL